MDMENIYSTWVEIDLGAIEDNVRYVRDLSGVEVMAIVKANAYGHGALPVAQAALQSGGTWCGVARIEEALELRGAGLDCPILLLGYTPAGGMLDAVNHKISMTVWSYEQVEKASAIGIKTGASALLHLKVDTGMGRLGIPPQGTLALAEHITNTPGIILEGLFTHFARADELDKAPSDHQEDIFRTVILKLEEAGLRPPLVHAANSAASLTRPSAHFNLVRFGIAMSGVSYGHEYITQKDERVGTIPVGYADGFRRTPGNYVLVGGRRAPVIGRVCMDQILVQLDEVPEAQAGDTVVLLGDQGNSRITAEDLAEVWGTINYEVVCAIRARVPRVLV
jgi:alanine racemase